MLRSLAPLGRNVAAQQFRKFERDFVQGLVEDQVKDMMGKPNLQTGAPSLGGGCASLLRKVVKSQFGEQPPHTPQQAVSKFKGLGFSAAESLAIIEGQPGKLADAPIQRLMGMGMFGSVGAAVFQREKYQTRDPLLAAAEAQASATQRLDAARAQAAAAEERAAQPLSFFLAEQRASRHD